MPRRALASPRHSRRLRRALHRRHRLRRQQTYFQVCYPEDTVASSLVDYRAGAGFEGMYEYEPPNGDDSASSPPASPTPASSAIRPSSSASPTPTTPSANPAWTPDQGTCQATFTWAAGTQPNPEHRQSSRHHALTPATSCSVSSLSRMDHSRQRPTPHQLARSRRRPHRRARPARPSQSDHRLDHDLPAISPAAGSASSACFLLIALSLCELRLAVLV